MTLSAALQPRQRGRLATVLAVALLASCGSAVQHSGTSALHAAENPEERALLAWLQASQRAGFERHDLAAYLAAWAPDATLTVARGALAGPYDRTIDFAAITATRVERWHAPPVGTATLRWREVRVAIDGDGARVTWLAESQSADESDKVREIYTLRRARRGESGRWRVVSNRLWPTWSIEGAGPPVNYDAATWARRDAAAAVPGCDGGRCPMALLGAWRFVEAWQRAQTLTTALAPTVAAVKAAQIWADRGMCAVLAGHVEDAEPSFRRALALWPAVPLPLWRSAAFARQSPTGK